MLKFLSLVCLFLVIPDLGLADSPKAALIIIDVQDCFISGGSLAVNGSDDIIPVINRLRRQYDGDFSLVVLSQDWHPQGHVSFASAHPGQESPVLLRYSPEGQLCEDGASVTKEKFPGARTCKSSASLVPLQQVLWPDHCVQNVQSGPTSSAFAATLDVHDDDLVIQKGVHKEIDSYSAFFDNGGFGKTRLDDELKRRGITHVFVTGLAGDYCVYFTSLDAKKLGYETYYVTDATRSVAGDSRRSAWTDLANKGVHLIPSDRVAMALGEMNSMNSARVHRGFPLLSLISTFVFLVKLIL